MINFVEQPKELPLINLHISAGHSNNPKRDRGASGNGQIEGVLTVRLRDKMVSHINKLGYRCYVDGDDTTLSDSLKYFRGKTNSKSIVVDIHFNSATATAKGTETLIPTKYTKTELELAFGSSKIISEVMGGIPLRGNSGGKLGVKTELDSHHGKLGWMTLEGNTILLEVCFLSNPNEVKKYLEVEDILAVKLAEYYLEQTCKELNIVDVQTVFYVVKSGDSLSKIAVAHKTTVKVLQELNDIKDVSKIVVGQRLKIK